MIRASLLSVCVLLIISTIIASAGTSANQNAFALESASSSENTVDCFSQSRAKSGATYYDCGKCTKEYNAKGTGNMRTCKVLSGGNTGTVIVVVTDPGLRTF